MTQAQPGRLVVAAAIVDHLAAPTRLLCAARSYPPEHAGQYELPGGKVEPGEEPAAALARELAEELHLTARLGQEILPTPPLAIPAPSPDPRWPGDSAPAWPAMHGFRMRVWLAELADPSEPVRPGKSHASVEWCAADALSTLPWLPADEPIVAAIAKAMNA